ncbi:MAG: NAD-dependent epimerase/dehydratase family protein [Planctomycetia bacterium]|nr:NAD-dependent epimerase/dehydratase family protein [Planctomycetia bacterium]
MQNRTILVTGATGFIGTKLVEKLLDRGYFVRGVGRSESPKLPQGEIVDESKLWKHPHFQYFRGDILDKESLERAMEGCDGVIHLAAYAKNWHKDRSTFDKFNIEGTRNVLEAAKKNGVQKIVCTSSIVTLGVTPKGVVGDENMPRQSEKCFTDYERTKLISERECLEAARRGEYPIVVVNPTRVFGPGQLSESNSVVLLMRLYESGKFPFLINFGKNVGNYVLVDDVAEGMILALERGKIGERYILGSDNLTLRKIYELVDEFRGSKGFKFPIWLMWPMIVSYSLLIFARLTGVYPIITPGWVRTFSTDAAFSSEKAKKELGYLPTPSHEAFRLTYEWIHSTLEK